MLDHRTVKILFTALCFFVALAVLYYARQVILLFVLAILFAHLLEPAVQFLQRHSLFFRDLRGPAVFEVYLASLVLIAVMIYVFAPGLFKAPAALLKDVPVSLDEVSGENVAKNVAHQYGWTETETLRLKAFLVSNKDQVRILVQNVGRVIPGLLGGFPLVPILAIFFLKDARIITRSMVRIVAPWGRADAMHTVLDEINEVLRNYVRAQVILAALSLGFYWIVLLLFRFPHAIALGLLGAALEFIPVAGWLITAAAIVSVGVFTQSHWIWVAVLLLVWRVIQDYVNVPRVMGRHLEIHPLLAILGIMVGWEVGGVVGVYFSIPVMAVIGVIWRNLLTESHPVAN